MITLFTYGLSLIDLWKNNSTILIMVNSSFGKLIAVNLLYCQLTAVNSSYGKLIAISSLYSEFTICKFMVW